MGVTPGVVATTWAPCMAEKSASTPLPTVSASVRFVSASSFLICAASSFRVTLRCELLLQLLDLLHEHRDLRVLFALSEEEPHPVLVPELSEGLLHHLFEVELPPDCRPENFAKALQPEEESLDLGLRVGRAHPDIHRHGDVGSEERVMRRLQPHLLEQLRAAPRDGQDQRIRFVVPLEGDELAQCGLRPGLCEHP